MPCRLIAPCLPSSAPQAPSGDEWLHEIKHDGFRVIARKDGTRVKLYSRPGNDLTDRFPLIVEALNKLRPRSCIIDGEAVACGEDGIASFDRNFVFRLFCLRLCLRLGRADRRPPRASIAAWTNRSARSRASWAVAAALLRVARSLLGRNGSLE